MKKYLFFFVAFIVLTSCDSNKDEPSVSKVPIIVLVNNCDNKVSLLLSMDSGKSIATTGIIAPHTTSIPVDFSDVKPSDFRQPLHYYIDLWPYDHSATYSVLDSSRMYFNTSMKHTFTVKEDYSVSYTAILNP